MARENQYQEADDRSQISLDELERRIADEFSRAQQDMQRTADEYFRDLQRRDDEMRQQVAAGKITEQQYKSWRLTQLARGERFNAMRDKMAARATLASEVAAAYINDTTPGIYSLNRNFAGYIIEKYSGDIDFTLWDEQTVRRLIMEHPDLMPYYPEERAIARGIDQAWGRKVISHSVTQSIILGESIPKMANRIAGTITNMSRTSAVRAARTAVTGAENGGRLAGMESARAKGIDVQKEWLSTLDGRTRFSHQMMDGKVAKLEDKFPNGCKYPGDPDGPPHEVYNCRCTLVSNIAGIDTTDAQRRARNAQTGKNEVISNMNYSQWANWKQENQNAPVYRPTAAELAARGAAAGAAGAAVRSFYKPISMQGLSYQEQEEINAYYQELDSRYHAHVEGVENLVENMQKEYDTSFEATVQYRMKQNPKKRRATIEKEVRDAMGPRPEAGAAQVYMYGGTFDPSKKVITINPTGNVYSSFAEDQKHRLDTRARWERRGRKEYNNFSNVPSSAAGTFLHEYGHAIDAEYSISDNQKFKEFYKKYSKKEIEHGLSSYAAENPQEFIAEAFCESFYQDQGDISKEFMKVLEEIVGDKR